MSLIIMEISLEGSKVEGKFAPNFLFPKLLFS